MKRFHSIKALVLVVVLAAAGAIGVHNVFAASTGQIYVTPASTSVQNGSNISVSVRINPGTTVDGAQFTLSFDATKLKYNSIDSSSSPFSVQLQQTVTSNSVTVARGQLSGGVSSDALIATISFQGIADSGTSALTLTNANATSGGAYTNPAVTSGSISLTAVPVTPPPTTPPPTTTPPPATGTGGSKSSSSGGSTKTSSGSGSKSSSSAGASTTPPQIVAENGNTSGTVTPQFTAVNITLKTTVPTQAYIKYGTDTKLSLATPLSGLETTHTIALDSSVLIPGTTYYYQVVVKDAAGNQTSTQVKSFTTKGYTLHVSVMDKNGHHLANAAVVLHSTPQSTKTDGEGVATFTDVAPGEHQVIYTNGKKQYVQAVTVSNTVSTDTTTGTQTAAVQNLSVQFATTTTSINMLLPVVIIGLLAVVALAFFLRGRFSPSPQHGYAAATIAQPASVSEPVSSDTPQNNGASIERAHGVQAPHPGSVITPAERDNEVK